MSKRAPLRSGVSLSGSQRLECTGCGKAAFATEELAQRVADRIRDANGTEMIVYLGDCQWYHLSRKNR